MTRPETDCVKHAPIPEKDSDTGQAVAELAGAYLAELEHAGRSAHTLRAYRSELARLAAFHGRRRR